ncbi:8602_t:CDS:2, partial [Paraglomus occultum]
PNNNHTWLTRQFPQTPWEELSVCLELAPETGNYSPGGHYKGSDDDVIKAIKYAKENNIAVAVCTGGHQYSGASSTNGDNIQLDVSETYQDFEWEDDDCTIVTFGISISLDDFNKNLGERDDSCYMVNANTSMWVDMSKLEGQKFRPFRRSFRIITADGEPRWVSHDFEQDKDLFYAVLEAYGNEENEDDILDVILSDREDRSLPLIGHYSAAEYTEDEGFSFDMVVSKSASVSRRQSMVGNGRMSGRFNPQSLTKSLNRLAARGWMSGDDGIP